MGDIVKLVADSADSLHGTAFGKYSAGLEVDIDELIGDISALGILIEGKLQAKAVGVELFSMVGSFGADGEVVISIHFSVYSTEGDVTCSIQDNYTIALGKDGYTDVVERLGCDIDLVINGAKAVTRLNVLLANLQSKIESSTCIRYTLGLNDRLCKVDNWDYDMIKVRLSRSAITQLIELNQSNALIDYVDDIYSFDKDVNSSLIRYIMHFNNIKLHKHINATFSNVAIADILTENMLSMNDTLILIDRYKGSSGKLEIRFVEHIQSLGDFIVIGKLSINYDKGIVGIEVDSGKVIDLEEGNYIYDKSIIQRVEKKLDISDYIRDTYVINR